MKLFAESNFYEILDIPVDASSSQIRRAYRNKLEVYGNNSLLTYSLFSDAERDDLLKRMQAAYNTLIDARKRTEYDAALREKSALPNTLANGRPYKRTRGWGRGME